MIDWAKMDTKWENEEYCLESVKKDGRKLVFVKNQTEQICLEAVMQNGYALLFVKEQTEQICLEAVKRKIDSFQFVKNQTPQLVYDVLKNAPNIDHNLIKITKQEWEQFMIERPELFL